MGKENVIRLKKVMWPDAFEKIPNALLDEYKKKGPSGFMALIKFLSKEEGLLSAQQVESLLSRVKEECPLTEAILHCEATLLYGKIEYCRAIPNALKDAFKASNRASYIQYTLWRYNEKYTQENLTAKEILSYFNEAETPQDKYLRTMYIIRGASYLLEKLSIQPKKSAEELIRTAYESGINDAIVLLLRNLRWNNPNYLNGVLHILLENIFVFASQLHKKHTIKNYLLSLHSAVNSPAKLARKPKKLKRFISLLSDGELNVLNSYLNSLSSQSENNSEINSFFFKIFLNYASY